MAAVRHVSNNGRIIPDWAQIVSLLANSGFAPAVQQVPATMINYGTFKNVPYISFRCGYGDYEINVFGDLDQPAAIQIGAMNYLHQTAVEKTNCVNFICSALANAADRKMVRALDWNQKDAKSNGSMTFETLLPGEMGSYGGWWVSVYDTNALAGARASDAEMLAITQPRVAATASGTHNHATAGDRYQYCSCRCTTNDHHHDHDVWLWHGLRLDSRGTRRRAFSGILPPLRPMCIRVPTRGRREPTAVTGGRF